MAKDSAGESDVKSDSNLSFFHNKVNSERFKSKIIWLRPRINDVKLNIELDTSSALSIIRKRDYRRHSQELKEAPIELNTYTCNTAKHLGALNVSVKHKNQFATKLPLYIMQNGGPHCLEEVG